MSAFLRLFGVVLTIGAAGCASANRPDTADSTPDDRAASRATSRDLLDYLSRLPGIDTRGSGSEATIHVSGSDYPNPPLFVIDGVSYGYEFSSIYSRVQPADIASVRVIRANDTEVSRYGLRGGNGVIEITIKRGR